MVLVGPAVVAQSAHVRNCLAFQSYPRSEHPADRLTPLFGRFARSFGADFRVLTVMERRVAYTALPL